MAKFLPQSLGLNMTFYYQEKDEPKEKDKPKRKRKLKVTPKHLKKDIFLDLGRWENVCLLKNCRFKLNYAPLQGHVFPLGNLVAKSPQESCIIILGNPRQLKQDVEK